MGREFYECNQSCTGLPIANGLTYPLSSPCPRWQARIKGCPRALVPKFYGFDLPTGGVSQYSLTMKSKRQAETRGTARGKSANRARTHYKKSKSRNKPIDREILIERKLPDHMVPQAKAIVLEQICDHGHVTRACVAAGVGRRTFYGWLHEPDGVFKKEYIEARRVWRASMIGDVEGAFSERAQYRDTLAGIFLLKHNTKRYREVSRLELTGKDGGPIVTADARDKLIERLDKLLDRSGSKPQIAAGSVEVHSIESSPAVGVRRVSSGSPGSRKARGVSYG